MKHKPLFLCLLLVSLVGSGVIIGINLIDKEEKTTQLNTVSIRSLSIIDEPSYFVTTNFTEQNIESTEQNNSNKTPNGSMNVMQQAIGDGTTLILNAIDRQEITMNFTIQSDSEYYDVELYLQGELNTTFNNAKNNSIIAINITLFPCYPGMIDDDLTLCPHGTSWRKQRSWNTKIIAIDTGKTYISENQTITVQK